MVHLPAEAAAEPPPMAWRLEGVQKNPDRLSLIVREIFDTLLPILALEISNFAIWSLAVVRRDPLRPTSTVWFLTLFGGLGLPGNRDQPWSKFGLSMTDSPGR